MMDPMKVSSDPTTRSKSKKIQEARLLTRLCKQIGAFNTFVQANWSLTSTYGDENQYGETIIFNCIYIKTFGESY